MAKKTQQNPVLVLLAIAEKRAIENPKNDIAQKIYHEMKEYVEDMQKRPYTLMVKRSEDKQFYGALLSRNNKVMDTTETMKNRRSIVKSFETRQIAYCFAQVVIEK